MEILPCIELETAPSPTISIIWLHGLGADGNDFVPIVNQLDLKGIPAIRFIFPSAPSIPVTINGGYVMPAWYDILGRDLVGKEDSIGIRNSEISIVKLIENEFNRGISYENIVLAGFSQGCAMALHVGLHFPHRLAGIIALSGYLPLAQSFVIEKQVVNLGTPIFMGHGTWDPVVIPQRGEASLHLLREQGYQVDWHTYPMEHSVHPEELEDISNFLKSIFTK
jgi:phospholipase/carboxylesterase